MNDPKYPDGKLGAHDQGVVEVTVGTFDGRVVLDFGKPVKWLAFTADEADAIGDLLKRRAAELRS